MKPTLLDQLLDLLTVAALAVTDPRPRRKFVDLALAGLCGPMPKTLTSALEWLEQRQEDWSADYRLFSQDQWDVQQTFVPMMAQALASPGCGLQRVYFGQDDTLVRKTGRKIPGVAYARDPLSPPFQVNLVLGQRFVQTSLLLQPGGSAHPWRALPVSFSHAPTPKIPKNASPQEQAALKEVRKKHRLSLVALEQLHFCRHQLDLQPDGAQRWLIDVVDGGYSNRTFFQGLPARTDAVARVRKDAKFRAHLPIEQRRGARKYGPALPCWPKVTQSRPMRLLVIKAAGYRLRKGSKLLYREPAFLITTDLTTPAGELIAAYLARWKVEVNFRDEKTLLGVGQAQVRSPQSVARAPAFLVAAYAMLLWSNIRVFGDRRTDDFEPLPAWRNTEPLRPSTRDLLRLLQKQAATYVNQMRN